MNVWMCTNVHEKIEKTDAEGDTDASTQIYIFRMRFFMYAVGSKIFRPDIQKPHQMENAVRDI
jgi:hypothetical protein